MELLEKHLDNLRKTLHNLVVLWPEGHLDFWDFIAAEGNLASGRGAYNFAAGTQNPRLSTIKGIERAIVAAEAALCLREAPYGALCQ